MDASLRTRAEQLATEFAGQAQTAADLNSFMRLMMQSALERMLNTEMDVHLGRRKLPAAEALPGPDREADATPVVAAPAPRSPNRRNGRSRKTVQGDMGELTITTPRDRDGTFEPQLIGKPLARSLRERLLCAKGEHVLRSNGCEQTTPSDSLRRNSVGGSKRRIFSEHEKRATPSRMPP